ncbi:MAG: hypothetical protein K1X79_03080 [Oligoflexia bacterium]|nr:hypothetical protein [Oligoflexia bacterium]
MVETALFLPVVFIIVLACIWISIMSNAKAAFHGAFARALRMAATRSDEAIINDPNGTIPVIKAWSGSGNAPPSPVDQMLGCRISGGSCLWPDNGNPGLYIPWGANILLNRHDLPPSTASQAAGTLAYATPGITLGQLAPSYIYSLAIIYQTMQQAVGSSLRFACNPFHPAGEGCLNCYFLPPVGAIPYVIPTSGQVTQLGIRCDFRPDTTITNALYNLIRLLAKLSPGAMNAVIISDTKYFDFTTGAIQ